MGTTTNNNTITTSRFFLIPCFFALIALSHLSHAAVVDLDTSIRQFDGDSLKGDYDIFVRQGRCPDKISHAAFSPIELEEDTGKFQAYSIKHSDITQDGEQCTSSGNFAIVPNAVINAHGYRDALGEQAPVVKDLLKQNAEFLVGVELDERTCGASSFSRNALAIFIQQEVKVLVPGLITLYPGARYMVVYEKNSPTPCTYFQPIPGRSIGEAGQAAAEAAGAAASSGTGEGTEGTEGSAGAEGSGGQPVTDSETVPAGSDEPVGGSVPANGATDGNASGTDAGPTNTGSEGTVGGESGAVDDSGADETAVTETIVDSNGDGAPNGAGNTNGSGNSDEADPEAPTSDVDGATDGGNNGGGIAGTAAGVGAAGAAAGSAIALDGDSDTGAGSSGDIEGFSFPEESVEPTDAEEDGGGSVCFPADATVQLENGHTVTMESLQLGDRVLVAPNSYSNVFMFTHRMNSVQHPFVQLDTVSGKTLTLTSGHYLYINGKLATAGSANVGDNTSDGRIVAVRSNIMKRGLYNPQTTHGDIVVDGIQASTYTQSVEPSMAHCMLAPMRALFSTFGFSARFLDQGADMFVSVLPSGSS